MSHSCYRMYSLAYTLLGHWLRIISLNTCTCLISLMQVTITTLCNIPKNAFDHWKQFANINISVFNHHLYHASTNSPSFYLYRRFSNHTHTHKITTNTRDEHYTIFYPPRALASYIPAYLLLLFITIPILYMGMNMCSCPALDSIDSIWDTRSNAAPLTSSSSSPSFIFSDSLPEIYDEDVTSINLRIRQRLNAG